MQIKLNEHKRPLNESLIKRVPLVWGCMIGAYKGVFVRYMMFVWSL